MTRYHIFVVKNIPTPLPEYPWQKVNIGSDIFVLNGNLCLIIVDYVRRYPKVKTQINNVQGYY